MRCLLLLLLLLLLWVRTAKCGHVPSLRGDRDRREPPPPRGAMVRAPPPHRSYPGGRGGMESRRGGPPRGASSGEQLAYEGSYRHHSGGRGSRGGAPPHHQMFEPPPPGQQLYPPAGQPARAGGGDGLPFTAGPPGGMPPPLGPVGQQHPHTAAPAAWGSAAPHPVRPCCTSLFLAYYRPTSASGYHVHSLLQVLHARCDCLFPPYPYLIWRATAVANLQMCVCALHSRRRTMGGLRLLPHNAIIMLPSIM